MTKHAVNHMVLAGRLVAVATSLDTMDSTEARDIVSECGGTPVGQGARGADTMVVSDSVAAAVGTDHEPVYSRTARSAGARVMSESDFLELTGADCGRSQDADRWVLVDDFLPTGKVDVENEPGYDGTIPPYKLYIQRTTRKSSSAGGWRIVDYGMLPDSGGHPWYLNPNRLQDGQDPSMPSPRGPRPNTTGLTEDEARPLIERYDAALARFDRAASRFDYRQLVGKVVVADHWAPSSCAELFDGMTYLTNASLLGLDTSRATSLRAMFRGCTSLRYMVETDRFDTSSVMDISEMFFNCLSLRVVSMHGWDISNVTNMSRMYENSPTYALWDTANVTRLREVAPDSFAGGFSEGYWLKSSRV